MFTLLKIVKTYLNRLPKPCNFVVQQGSGDLLPQMDKESMNINNDNMQYEALEAHQRKYSKGNDTQKDTTVFSATATVAV